MADPQAQPDPFELLADDFVARCRRGERPSVSEFADRHDQHAERIRALFPAIAMLEGLRVAKHVEHEQAVRRLAGHGVPADLGDFEIVREIGRGGMGVVFEAHQRSLHRRVALKVLPNHTLLRERELARFRREARTAAGLHHTNIVPVYGVGEHEGVHYYVMPLIRGVGLDEIVRELRRMERRGQSVYCTQSGFGAIVRRLLAQQPDSGPANSSADQGSSDPADASSISTNPAGDSGAGSPPAGDTSAGATPIAGNRRHRARKSSVLTCAHWPAVARVGIQAAQALHHAHTHGTLHRDVKPANLLVDSEGTVCVADFGLARAVDRTDGSHSGDARGTLRYMAPEQCDGRADARSDLYSLGLTLYELATLRPAWATGRRRLRRAGKPAGAGPVRPAKIAPTIPRDLETIILKCLADRPEARYATAGELAADLQRFLEDRPIRARRVSVSERVGRWARRNPALAATSALALLLLLAVTVTTAIGLARTRAAHARTEVALVRAQQHSELALDVLEDIYRQISPDRFGIAPAPQFDGELPSDASGLADASLPTPVRSIPPSQETALLLENLLGFYDRLAEQVGQDPHITLDSAIACRRVGDIRRRLGQLELAEQAYRRAIDKLNASAAGDEIAAAALTELARNHNELGTVQMAWQDVAAAHASHERARSLLMDQADHTVRSVAAQYELARTLYLLTNTMPGRSEAHSQRDNPATTGGIRNDQHRRSEYRRQASRILQRLAHADPAAPDCRFLLALCRRPLRPVTLNSPLAAARRDAIEILEQLVAEYPEVPDYRYELASTYAWVHVGLYPWQTRSSAARDVEPALHQALRESRWLVEHYPSIPEYTHAQAVILAKLGSLCWTCDRLPEAEAFFRQAFETQEAVIYEFSGVSPPHLSVFCEFLRLRTAQISVQLLQAEAAATVSADALAERLDTCIDNLTELLRRPELAEDRLAGLALREACQVRSSLPAPKLDRGG
jgi:serine/threonine protein kinase